MKLSMWILADWLTKYNPEIHIKEGNCVLERVRFLTDEQHRYESCVFVGHSKNMAAASSNQVSCYSGDDLILLETSDVEAIFNEISDAFEFYWNWHDHIRRAIHDGCTVQILLDQSSHILDDFTFVTDSGYLLKGHCCETPQNREIELVEKILEENMIPMDRILVLNDDDRIKNAASRAYVVDYPTLPKRTISRNLFLDHEHIGWLILVEIKHLITPGRIQFLDILGDIIEEDYARYGQEVSEIFSYERMFVDILFENAEMPDSINHKMMAINWQPDDDKLVFKIVGCNQNRDLSLALLRKLEAALTGCILLHHDESIILISSLTLISHDVLIRHLQFLLKQAASRCGSSFVFQDINQLKDAYSQAEIAITYGTNIPGDIQSCNDCAVEYSINLLRSTSHADLRHPGIRKLNNYDTLHNSNLSKTLWLFLFNERNNTETAKQLFIHKNTLAYRISRIEEIAGISLDDSETRFHLLISCYLDYYS